jgi:hypothetical protein
LNLNHGKGIGQLERIEEESTTSLIHNIKSSSMDKKFNNL